MYRNLQEHTPSVQDGHTQRVIYKSVAKSVKIIKRKCRVAQKKNRIQRNQHKAHSGNA